MDNPDIWLHICSRLNNDTLERLSQTRLWLVIREFAASSQLWYLRVCFLVSLPLQPVSSDVWKEAYYDLTSGHPRLATTELLLHASRDCSYDWNSTLTAAIELCETEVVKLLLQDSRVEPRLTDLGILMESLKKGGTAQVIAVFLMDERVRFSNPLFFILASFLDRLTNEDESIDKIATLDQETMLTSVMRGAEALVLREMMKPDRGSNMLDSMRKVRDTLIAYQDSSSLEVEDSDLSDSE